MTKFTRLLFRATGMIMIVLWSLGMKAQTSNSATLIWDYQVGCIEYDYEGTDPKRGIIFNEDVENAPCIRVCERSKVNYTVQGTGIAHVDWVITGGNLMGTSGGNNQNAEVQWGNAGNGAIHVTITYTDQSIKVYTPCVEIIHSPKAMFDIEGLNEEKTFCLNTPITFDNLSIADGGTEIIYYNWDFGDGNYSHEFEPTHSYDQPGDYDVTLVVVNKCNCVDKYTMSIRIIERPDVVISCPSVVCEDGDKVTYTVNDECGGEWVVEGGTIVGQSPQRIDVVWDQVDQDGFGYVNFKSECGCPLWTTVKVPVVQKRGFIKGPDVACLNEQTRYSLPQWPTTDFKWALNGNPMHPMLVYTDQRNEVYVNGLTPGTYSLTCEYTNTLLGCSGYAEKRITVLPSVTITGPEEFCSGVNESYTNAEGASVNWTLKLNNNVVSTSSGVNFSYDFSLGGTYVLTATSSGGCDSEPFIINVIQTPSISGSIIGENSICPGVAYDYSYNNTDNNSVLHWEVDGGSIQGSDTGDEISVVFNNTGPYEVRVKKESLTSDCESEWLEKPITKLDFTPIIVNNDGLSEFCPSSETTFTVNIGGIVPDLIEWEIESVGSGPSNSNFGNIISGVNGTDVTVSFNEISTFPDGILKVTVYKCGMVKTDEFDISLMPQPDLGITAPAMVCANESFDITLTSTTPLTSGTIVWTVNGQTYNRNIATDGLTLTGITVDNVEPNNLSAAITASVTHPNGCLYNLTTNGTVTIEPRPVVQIGPGNVLNKCPDENGVYSAATIHANTNYSSSMPVSFKWFKNGIEMPGETSSTLNIPSGTTSPAGTYYVTATFDNTDGNCSTQSSSYIITSDDCEEPPYCDLNFSPNVTIQWSWTDCNRIDFTGDYNDGGNVYPIELNWLSSNPANFTGYDTNTETPYFITDTPGVYIVQFEVFYMTPQGPCKAWATTTVKKHYEPKFNYTISCNGTNNYTVNLIDNSTLFEVLPGDLNYNYSTTSGTLSQSGTGATITNLGPGNHTFTLELSSGSIGGVAQPTCTYEVQVNIEAMDVPVLTYPVEDQLFCAEDVITLPIPGGYNPNYSYTWYFDGTSYQATEDDTDINITNPGPAEVYLEVTNQYNCSVTSEEINIIVEKADFEGSLSPTTLSFCEGTAGGNIVYQPGFGSETPSGYIWMKGNQQVGTTTTPSFMPTESGSYWVILLNEHDCRYGGMAEHPVNVVVRKRPYVNVIGETNLCMGEDTTLQGIVSDSNLERRWLLNGTPMATPYGTWSTTTPLTPVVNPAVSGTYTYTLQVRPVSDTDCGNEQDFTVTLSPAVSDPTLSYTVITCEPYTVKIEATGPSNGNYNWSNGDSGQTITVYNGGVYQVTYTAPSGCSVSASITVPHVSDRYMWVFPTGCFDVCPFDDPQPYIIGPWATFDNYAWLVNGNVVQSGSNMAVQDLPVDQGGTYQLIVQNDGCTYESGIAYITPDPERCELEPCNIEAFFKEEMIIENGEYFLVGAINNPNPFPITVSLTSFNGYGIYIPGTVTIPAGGTYNFNPLNFIPNPGFTGGMDYIVMQIVGQNCMTLHRVNFPSLYGGSSVTSSIGYENDPYLTVSPNPASSIVAIDYDISPQYERADEIHIHDMNGRLLMRLPVDNAAGQIAVNVSSWQSATYIVSLYAADKRVLHQKLLVR